MLVLSQLAPALSTLRLNADMISANSLIATHYNSTAPAGRASQPTARTDARTQALMLALAGHQEGALSTLVAGDTLGRDLLFIGDSLARVNRPEESLWWYQQAVALPESTAQAWQRQGEAAERLGRLASARGHYEKAWELDPARYTRDLVELLQIQGDQEAVLAVLSSSLLQMPEHDERAWWWNQSGLALQALGRWEEAHAVYQQGVAEFPDNILLWLALSHAGYEIGGGFEAAWQELQTALALEPDRAGTLFAAGELLAREGRWAEADEWFVRALALEPNNRSWEMARAEAARNSDDLDLAVELYQDLLEKYPGNAAVHYEAAWAFRLAGSVEPAAQAIERALQLTGRSNVTHLIRAGEIYEWLGNTQRAHRAYQTALGLAPNNRAAQRGLARTDAPAP